MRGVTRQHFVQDRAKRVNVRAVGDVRIRRRLLGRHVVRRAQRQARLRPPAAGRRAHRQRDAEVRDERVTVPQEDVFGLDVPVDDTLVVRVLQRVRYFGGNGHRLVNAELLLAIELLPERFPLHIRHDVIQEPRVAAVCRCRAAAVV
ncbi:hypothetical protein BH23GEM3_BH23GEM3_00470 [soil metagenome]